MFKNSVHYKLKGSYTVEAALVIPLVLGIIFLIINISFYMYDYNVMHEDVIRIAQKYIHDYKHTNKEIKEKIELEGSISITDKMISAKEIYVSANVNDNKIEVSYNAKLHIPSNVNIEQWNKKNWTNIDIETSVSRLYPVDYIRKCRRLGD